MVKLLETLEMYEHHHSDVPAHGIPSRLQKVTGVRKVLINPSYIVTARPFAGKLEPYSDEALVLLRDTFGKQDADLPTDYVEVVLDGNSFRTSSMIIPCPLRVLIDDLECLTVE